MAEQAVRKTPVVDGKIVRGYIRLLPLLDVMGGFELIGGMPTTRTVVVRRDDERHEVAMPLVYEYRKQQLTVLIYSVRDERGEPWRVLKVFHSMRMVLPQEAHEVKRCFCGEGALAYLRIEADSQQTILAPLGAGLFRSGEV